jgi:hypothetical protein
MPDVDLDELENLALGNGDLDALEAQADPDEDESDPPFLIRWGGQTVEVRIGKLTGLEWARFRQTLGVDLMEGLRSGSLDAIACVLWLQLRRGNKKLRYVDVASRVTLNDVVND